MGSMNDQNHRERILNKLFVAMFNCLIDFLFLNVFLYEFTCQ